MDQRDVARIGENALLGALTSLAAAAGPTALLGLTVQGVLELYGGSRSVPPPPLTTAAIQKVVEENLLKQDVRDAWSRISPTHDWYRDRTIRAKSGEKFSEYVLGDLDKDLREAMGTNSLLKSGLTLLYNGTPNIASTPGQFGVPYLIVGVGLYVQILELDIVRTRERGGDVSPGTWQLLAEKLRYWSQGIEACDRFAETRAAEAVMATMRKNHIKPGTPAHAALVRENDIIYRGGASADGDPPARKAMASMYAMLRKLETEIPAVG